MDGERHGSPSPRQSKCAVTAVPAADRLAEIEARARAATLGPWRWFPVGHNRGNTIWAKPDDPQVAWAETATDAEFIAHARRDVTFLLAAFRLSREREDALAAEIAVTADVLEAVSPDDEGWDEDAAQVIANVAARLRRVLAGAEATSPEASSAANTTDKR